MFEIIFINETITAIVNITTYFCFVVMALIHIHLAFISYYRHARLRFMYHFGMFGLLSVLVISLYTSRTYGFVYLEARYILVFWVALSAIPYTILTVRKRTL